MQKTETIQEEHFDEIADKNSKFDFQFVQVGKITETKNGWKINIKTEEGKIEDIFPNLEAALKFCEKAIRSIQNIQNIPLSLEYIRISGSKTFITYKDKASKPKEYAPFDYLCFNASQHPNWERRTYLTPRYFTYNTIARVSAAEKVVFRRVKNIIDSISFLSWVVLAIFAVLIAMNPSNEAQSAAIILGLKSNDPIAWGLTIAFQFLGFCYILVDNIPRYIFHYVSKSTKGQIGSRHKSKSYGEVKSWKTFYRSRTTAMWLGQVILIMMFVALFLVAIEFNNTIFSEFELHFKETIILVMFGILGLGMLVTEQSFHLYSMLKIRQRRERLLNEYVATEAKPYFKSWTLFNGIEDADLEFNWTSFIYKPTKEDLEESYRAMVRNIDMSKAKRTLLKRELDELLVLGLSGLKDATKTLNMSKEKLRKQIQEEKMQLEKTAMLERANRKPSKLQLELQKTQMIERKMKIKEEEDEQKMVVRQAKILKKQEENRIKKAKSDRKRQIKLEREKMKNGLYW